MEEGPNKSFIRWGAEDLDPAGPVDRPVPPDSDGDADGVPLLWLEPTASLPPDAPSGFDDVPLFFNQPGEPSAAPSAEPEEETSKDEPFDRPDAHKVGILGGKGVGKSYLFQAMVYRTYAGLQSGALTYYLERDGIHLFKAVGGEGHGKRELTETGLASALNRVEFIRKYQSWQRLSTTRKEEQQWYRLRLLLRTGWLGRTQSAMDVEFFEGSGEGFFELQTVSHEDRALWTKAYQNAGVMVFCLPIWAAFPSEHLTDEDWNHRDALLRGFEQVVQNYLDMRRREETRLPVSSILALTMSDDRRSALRMLYDRWISPYLDSPHTYLKQMRKGRGVARYLNNARRISERLQEEFAAARDPRVTAIPQSLDFGRGRPWIVALSATEGSRLDDLERRFPNPDDPARLAEARRGAPTPVHVELPLLLALCERENALM
jgi:hypothetical protein